MADIRVAILYSQSLFAAGAESQLQGIDEISVIRVDAAEEEAVTKMYDIAPDIIIVDTNDGAFAANAMIPEILNQIRSAKVICLDLNSDEISIYRREGRAAHSGADLVAAIREH